MSLPTDPQIERAFHEKLGTAGLLWSQRKYVEAKYWYIDDADTEVRTSFSMHNHKLIVSLRLTLIGRYPDEERKVQVNGNLEAQQEMPRLTDSMYEKLLQKCPQLLTEAL